MSEYFEEQVSKLDSRQLGVLIKLRIQRYPRVEVFQRADRVFLRTFRHTPDDSSSQQRSP